MTNNHTPPSARVRGKRRPQPSPVADHIDGLLRDADAHRQRQDVESAWRLLEDAHVLSQPWVRHHLRVHIAMLSLGWALRNRTEVIGQIVRLILAGPGSALGRYPVGNTGRANVSAFKTMPIRDDLASLLSDIQRPGTDVGCAPRARRPHRRP